MKPVVIGVGGPVGSGKTLLIERVTRAMNDKYSCAVITNDIYTKEDAKFMVKNSVLSEDRVIGVETGGCPHTAIREDASMNFEALDELKNRFDDLDIIFLESGGDNLAATFSPDLVDFSIYIIDVAQGEKIPRKAGQGMIKSDLFIINKIDLAPYVGADLEVMRKDRLVVEKLELGCWDIDNSEWIDMVSRLKNLKGNTNIALVGKYVELHDAYLSVVEALNHGGLANGTNVNIKWVNAVDVTSENIEELLGDVNGVLVPGGFGDRGIEGKIEAIKYARENKIPFLGICLGMQTAVIEFARNVVGYDNANSYEINPETKYPVIDLMPEQKDIEDLGGTMRLGLYPCKLKEGSKVNECYDDKLIYERHRHRYEFNNEYRKQIISSGMKITGTSPDGRLVEIVELENHPWFVAVQFHPELKSRPNKPHPLFKGFIKASLGDN